MKECVGERERGKEYLLTDGDHILTHVQKRRFLLIHSLQFITTLILYWYDVCGSAYENGMWSMVCVLRRRIDYYYMLGLRGRVVRLCFREVSLTLVSFTHLILV